MSRKMKPSGIEWIGDIPEEWEVCRVKNYFSNHKIVVGDKSSVYQRLALTLSGVIKRSKEDSSGLQPEAFNGYQILKENEWLNHRKRLILYQNWKYSQPTDDLGSNGKTIPK